MKRLPRALLLVSTILACTTCMRAEDTSSRFEQQLAPVIREVMEENRMPGLAIAVIQGGKLAYTAGFGVKSLDDPSEKVTPESLFHMASITKTFVATAVMQLAEQGKVDLDAPVVTYLPYFELNDDRYKAITVRQLLCHRSGMPDVIDYEWHKPQYDDGALERYVRGLRNRALIAPLGTKTRYSNIAYEVLGDLIAKVSGETFEGYVRQHILQPLGMKHSTLLLKEADAALLVRPHRQIAPGEVAVSPIFPYNRIHAPSSTLYSNVLDMAQWAIANLQRGQAGGQRILKTEAYDALWTSSSENRFPDIGICWFLGRFGDQRKVAHSGSDVGFKTDLALLPDIAIGVVLMTNVDRVPLWKIRNAALKVAVDLRPAEGRGRSR
jgi:CubicO group peptidase (beta-lactamase class C family)